MQRRILIVLFAVLTVTRVISAQIPAAPTPVPQLPPPVTVQTPATQIAGCKVSETQASTQEVLSKEFEGKTERVLVLTGKGALSVRVDCDDMQFFAETVVVYQDRHRIVATGNVTFVSSNNRISAERMEF